MLDYRDYQIKGNRISRDESKLVLMLGREIEEKVEAWNIDGKNTLLTVLNYLTNIGKFTKSYNREPKNFSFKFKDGLKKEVGVALRYGDMLEDFPAIYINEFVNGVNILRRYYCDVKNKLTDYIDIDLESIEFTKDGVTVGKYIGENFSTLNVYSNGYSYKIYCYGKKDNKEDVRLNNEVELMNKLLEIEKPISAIDLYKLVKECVQDLSNLSKFRIVINEQKSKKTVGELEIIDNNLVKCLTSKKLSDNINLEVTYDLENGLKMNVSNLTTEKDKILQVMGEAEGELEAHKILIKQFDANKKESN